MTSEERMPRTPKTAVTLPGSLTVGSSKRRFTKVGRKQSNESVQSSSSSGTTRSAESIGVRQPAKSKIRRHNNRLSAVFSRSPTGGRGEMSAAGDDPLATDDPSELSNHITAPGILKIFGNEICEGANYKSVLATTHSSAKELVKEALERYCLSKAEADAYVLCDVIGYIGDHQWTTECLRVVCDNEKPLLLQSLWKPKEGYARRFEIQRRASVEAKTSKDKDTVTAGINAQARKLQKTRSRVMSALLEGGPAEGGLGLWRSLSEADLSAKGQGPACGAGSGGSVVCQNDKALLRGEEAEEEAEEAEEEAYKAARCPGSEREETESSDDNSTQYSIHPPHEFPYFLLLQGYSYRQDFVIYPLGGASAVFGRSDAHTDVPLWAPDILPRHCNLRHLETGHGDRRPETGHGDLRRETGAGVAEQEQGGLRGAGSTLLTPLNGAPVKRNGVAVTQEAELRSGDIISLGSHYLFMFKDPTAAVKVTTSSPATFTLPWVGQASGRHRGAPLCKTCVSSGSEARGNPRAPGNARPCLRDSEGRELSLAYDLQHEERVLGEIFATGSQHPRALHKLTPAFLLCLCLQHSATHFEMADLRRLLLRIANEVQMAMCANVKDLAALQPEDTISDGVEDPGELQPLGMEKLIPGLQPLALWMANSVELLHFIQLEVPHVLHGSSVEEEEEEEEEERIALLELRLSSIRSASEEAMTVLEEVIMFTFQQCVYYLTKTLYPVLPGLLESNPFSESGQLQVPGDVGCILDVLKGALRLLREFHVHWEVALQLFTYLFFFINAFLFNTLMERGLGGSFYQWSRGVQIRANLDLLMDWTQGAGLGDLALGRLLKLSSAVNLLATPRENLLQASWSSLRTEFAPLNAAQLHHMLREYTPRRPCPSAWTPSSEEANAALRTADILESFDDHPPLILPCSGFLLELRRPIREARLAVQLGQLQEFIRKLRDAEPGVTAAPPPQRDSAVPLEAKVTKMEVLPKAQLESGLAEMVLPQPTNPSVSMGTGNLGSCEAILAQKLRSLELQHTEVTFSSHKRSALDPSCLLTPPNTPQSLELVDSETDGHENDLRHQTVNHHSSTQGRGEGLSPASVDERKREEDEDEEEVFTLELQRGTCGLGLTLVNGAETLLNMSGIYIQSVMPESPAALCQRLRPGDRILAVNGASLVGMDYLSGRELIQSSGVRPRLLVARSEWTGKETAPKR